MENREERTISLNDLLKAFAKYWYIIASTVLIGLIVTYVLAFHLITPKYRASVEVIVRGRKALNQEEYTTREAITYVDTVESFFKSDAVGEKVVEKLNNPNVIITQKELSKGISTSKSSAQSVILKVYFVHEDKELAVQVINELFDTAYNLANNAPEHEFFEGIFTKMQSAKEAKYYSPNKTLYLIVGFLLGGIVGAGLVLMIDLGRATYRTKEQIEEDLEIEVIGVIPEFEVSKNV